MRSQDYSRGKSTQSWDSFFGQCEKSTGYFLECDITFSDKCKSDLRDFPPAPVHKSIKFEDLSKFAQDSFVTNQGSAKSYKEESKLMLTFEKKCGYVIHSALANEYSMHGVEFSNITRVLAFHQSDFLKGWVELNTRGRKMAAEAKNDTLKSFFKVFVIAVFLKVTNYIFSFV